MRHHSETPPSLRKPHYSDFKNSITLGVRDFLAAPLPDLFFASFFVGIGLLAAWITYVTGQTFWLILSVLAFPLIGGMAAFGFYDISLRRQENRPVRLRDVLALVWSHKNGQLPWLTVIIVVIFLFWFFLGHMIFALFLGLSPMTNISSSLGVFFTSNGLQMLVFGTLVGAVFATLIFAMSVFGIPMLLDRDVDFVTAMLTSMRAVRAALGPMLIWGCLIAVITLIAMLPLFLGLFVAMPVLGHATWHLYCLLSK